MIDWTLVADLAVAIGTILLATVTGWLAFSTYRQSREVMAERSAQLRRELADTAYVEALRELRPWVKTPDSTPEPAFHTWRWLKAEDPFLTARIPQGVREVMSKLDDLDHQVQSRRQKLRQDFEENLPPLASPLAERQGRPPPSRVVLRVLVGARGVHDVDPFRLSIWSQDLASWATKTAAARHEPTWSAEVLGDGQRIGGTEEATWLVTQSQAWLEKQPLTAEIRGLHHEMVDLGARAIQVIHAAMEGGSS